MNTGLIFLPPARGAPPPPPRPGPGDGKAAALRATRVLIVEDEVMIAWMIETIVEEMGFQDIEIVSSRAQALASSSDVMPGLLISDINLGQGGNGIDAAADIVRRATLPVIFVTAYADDATRARVSRELPSAQLLRKPVQDDALREAIWRALAPGAQ